MSDFSDVCSGMHYLIAHCLKSEVGKATDSLKTLKS
jgi:hypothetical protein